jgi:pentatricopeptide repeat protein
MQTDIGCLCKNLSYDEAFEVLQQFIDSGKENCTIEEYEWIDPEHYQRLGRDPDLH